MKKTWILRQELYKSLHRWPSMIAMLALGCVVGFIFSFIWSPNYRAISEVYVGLNPYRTYEDNAFLALIKPKYSNLDNYLFWQMAQLEEVAYLGQYLQESLAELQMVDPYWKNETEERFREMIKVDWRTAGKWNFIVENPKAEYAEQAVKIWSEIVKKRTENAVLSAQETFMIDQELTVIQAEKLNAQLRKEELQRTMIAINIWKEAVRDTTPNNPVNAKTHWEILNIVTLSADFSPIWQNILQQQPIPGSPLENYYEWIDQVSSIIQSEIVTLEQKISSLDGKTNQLSDLYTYKNDISLGLSPNLAIEKIVHQKPRIVRPTSAFILIGGITGLLGWILYQLVMISRNAAYDK